MMVLSAFISTMGRLSCADVEIDRSIMFRSMRRGLRFKVQSSRFKVASIFEVVGRSPRYNEVIDG
jgi:hypothetical protein